MQGLYSIMLKTLHFIQRRMFVLSALVQRPILMAVKRVGWFPDSSNRPSLAFPV
jgi:hypothetical protein